MTVVLRKLCQWPFPGGQQARVSCVPRTDTVPAVHQRPGDVPARSPGVSLQPAVPVLLFLLVNRIAGLRWAVIVATMWSVKVLVDRRRRGISLGVFMPLLTAAILIRGAIGAITGSETLYFGLGIATKYMVGAALIVSLAVRKPLARYAAPYVLALTDEIREHERFRRAVVATTAVGSLYFLVSATVDVWLFRRNDVEGFVLWRFLANWPLSAVAIAAIATISQLQLGKIPGVVSAHALFEDRMSQYWPQDDARNTDDSPLTDRPPT